MEQHNKKDLMAVRADKKLDVEVSLLGFGCMRLPRVEEGKEDIDVPAATQLVDYAYEHGVNYFDTAWNYHDGTSEAFIGNALKKYPRDSFYLATKMPTWAVNDREEAEKVFEQQLKNCQVDYFDFYLLHAISSQSDYDSVYEKGGIYEYLQEEKAKGRIRRLGFSFHGSPLLMQYLLEKHDWDFAQIQLNYMDWHVHDAKRLYAMLEERGIPCIIMEPVHGGSLANLNPEAVEILKKEAPDKTPASWAVKFVASLPNILTVLSGMSTMEQVEDNVQTLTGFEPLAEDQKAVLKQALTAYMKSRTIPCTACRYCMPCPFGVEIPRVFETYNEAVCTDNVPDVKGEKNAEFTRKKNKFLWLYDSIPPNNRAKNCTACERCIMKCPQRIKIPEWMRFIRNLGKAIRGS